MGKGGTRRSTRIKSSAHKGKGGRDRFGFLICILFAWGTCSFLRPLFPRSLPYNRAIGQRGQSRDSGLCRQCVCAEYSDGLSAAAGNRQAGRRSSPAKALHIGGSGRGKLCRSGISPWVWIFGVCPGEAGGRTAAGAGGFWRGGAVSPAGAAAFRRCQRHGGMCAGVGTAGGKRRADGKRRVLHGCGCQSTAGGGDVGLHCAGSGVSRFGETGDGGQAAAGPGQCGRAHRHTDGSAGYWQRPPGTGERETGAGGSPRRIGRTPVRRDPAAVGAGEAAVSGRRFRAAAAGISAAAAAADPLSRGWDPGGPAAGSAHGLDGDKGKAVSGPDGGVVAHRAGGRIYGPVGR